MTEGICPSNWHIPSDEEFTQLTDFLGGEIFAGYVMKSTSGWNGGGNGSNSSGFNGLPGGYRVVANFSDDGSAGYWWSDTGENNANSWSRQISFSPDDVDRTSDHNYLGFSARCVRD